MTMDDKVVLVSDVAAPSVDAAETIITTTTTTTTTMNDVPKSKPGMISEVKNLYQSKEDRRGRTIWVERYPDDLPPPAENEVTARFALLIRNKKCFDGRKKLTIDSIVVQSPILKEALGPVFDKYPGLTVSLERLEFKAPFVPFVYRWNQFSSVVKDEQDPEKKAHLGLLYRVLEEEMRDNIKARDDLLAHKVITFDYLWMLFEPGTVIYTNNKGGQERAVRLVSGAYRNNNYSCRNYNLSCQKVDWDGEKFGYGSDNYDILEYDGTAPISSLSAFPLIHHPQKLEISKELINRGREFERLAGYNYKSYLGFAMGEGPWGPVRYNVNSRIIIDTYAWNRFKPNSQVSVEGFNKAKEVVWDPIDDTVDSDYDNDEDYEIDGYSEEVDEKPSTIQEAKRPKLTEDKLLLCTSTLKGYSLKNKQWMTFSIENVKEMKWNAKAFESLVLPEDHKDLILALTESQTANKNTFDDIIQGKGMGMIMLLSGPPGVGKTLTADSVAETMRVPLYMMSAGDLGTQSFEVKSNLSNVLEICTKWNAILLLDEADVFLEQRSAHDLERNKLVSIFLRILEYYEGILFLTTNRVDNIDAAFQSRIHISMAYKNLSTSSRRHVWSNFINSLTQAHDISDQDLDKLAAHVMNGREIKNVLKTAQLLASKKGKPLRYEYLETVLSIGKRFSMETDDDASKESTA